MIIGAAFITKQLGQYLAFVGGLSIMITSFYHMKSNDIIEDILKNTLISLGPSFLIFLVLTLYFESQLNGFMTVFLFMTIISLSGKCTKDVVPPICFSSFLILLYYIAVIVEKLYLKVYYLKFFDAGVQFNATLVYFTCLLVLSCRYYYDRNISHPQLYIMNLIYILSFFAAMFMGNLDKNLMIFRGVSGTFGVIYILLLFVQVEWNNAWPLALLLFSGLLFGIIILIKSYPEYFLFSYLSKQINETTNSNNDTNNSTLRFLY